MPHVLPMPHCGVSSPKRSVVNNGSNTGNVLVKIIEPYTFKKVADNSLPG